MGEREEGTEVEGTVEAGEREWTQVQNKDGGGPAPVHQRQSRHQHHHYTVTATSMSAGTTRRTGSRPSL